jgi:hypothetical protein
MQTSATASRSPTDLGLDIGDSITKGVDDLDVLNIWDSIPDIVETFHIIPEALIKLLLDSLYGFSRRGILVCDLEVLNEHDT